MQTSTDALIEKMKRREAFLAFQKEKNTLSSIQRRAKKSGGGKHSLSAWLYDLHFGAGDYDPMDREPQTSNH